MEEKMSSIVPTLSGVVERNDVISFIRALSMLMIISCHIMQYLHMELAWWFNVGVQVFLCISGFLYGQKELCHTTSFLRQRFKKILVPYYLVYVFFGSLEFIFVRDTFNFVTFLRGLFVNAVIKGGEHLWFIPTILMCYIITPMLQDYKVTIVKDKRGLWRFTIISLVASGIFFGGFSNYFNPAWISCYVIGYSLGINENTKLISEKFLLLLFGVIAVMGNGLQIYCTYFSDLSIPKHSLVFNYNHVMLGVLIFLLCKAICQRHNMNRIKSILDLSDKYSYEVYLVHQFVVLGPFSLMGVTQNVVLNCLAVLGGICVLVIFLKKAEHVAFRFI